MRRPADGLGDESVWLGSLSSLLPERREHGYKLSAHGEVNKAAILCLTALFSSITSHVRILPCAQNLES